jgi:hypothetical protein
VVKVHKVHKVLREDKVHKVDKVLRELLEV